MIAGGLRRRRDRKRSKKAVIARVKPLQKSSRGNPYFFSGAGAAGLGVAGFSGVDGCGAAALGAAGAVALTGSAGFGEGAGGVAAGFGAAAGLGVSAFGSSGFFSAGFGASALAGSGFFSAGLVSAGFSAGGALISCGAGCGGGWDNSTPVLTSRFTLRSKALAWAGSTAVCQT